MKSKEYLPKAIFIKHGEFVMTVFKFDTTNEAREEYKRMKKLTTSELKSELLEIFHDWNDVDFSSLSIKLEKDEDLY